MRQLGKQCIFPVVGILAMLIAALIVQGCTPTDETLAMQAAVQLLQSRIGPQVAAWATEMNAEGGGRWNVPTNAQDVADFLGAIVRSYQEVKAGGGAVGVEAVARKGTAKAKAMLTDTGAEVLLKSNHAQWTH